MNTKLTKLLAINHPIIMAPMFLVSNTTMVIEAMKNGIAGCIPALNYRTLDDLKLAIQELKKAKVTGGAFGFNLIVNKSNLKYKDQLDVICNMGCDFIITSLGSPEETIIKAKKSGIKVFCDIVDLKFAKKVEALGADAIIAVNNEAGGHRGHISPQELIKTIVEHCKIPVISAGGVGVGTKQTWLESVLNKNKRLKKWVKMIRFAKGMNDTKHAATQVTYKTVWVAGPSIEHTKSILPVKKIIDYLIN